MRAAIWIVVLVGCGGAVQYGSFVGGRSEAQAAMALDAARKLATEYAPDSHALRLLHAATDSFGRSFAAELRKAGYAVQDGSADELQDAKARSADELQVRYVVDQLKGTQLLRVTLYLPRTTLSRAYAERASGVFPVGPWSMGSVGGSNGS